MGRKHPSVHIEKLLSLCKGSSMLIKKIVPVITLIALVTSTLPVSVSQADSGTPAKILASKTVTGTRAMVKVSGDAPLSGPLWTAKIPTKMKLSKSYGEYSGMVNFKLKNVASDGDGEKKDDVRVTIALWSAGGKEIQERTLFDWSPVSSLTSFEYRIFGADGVKPGKYVWVITTASFEYAGEGQLKVPVSIS
jgi:hypothetical protein